jgi:acyl-CoA synthetase (AMP-forming)/AMP-acid ligase II
MIIRSPYPDVAVPDAPLTEVLFRSAEERPDKPALVCGVTGHTLTYGELVRQIRSTAAGLAARGFGKGDVLGIYSYNRPEYLVAFYAAALLGGVATTANPLYTAEELAKQLEDSGARMLVTVPEFVERAREGADRAGITELYVFGEAEGAIPFAELVAAEGEPPDVEIDPDESLVALPYSSGTTGMPKGVMLTHRNLVSNVHQVRDAGLFEESDVLLCVLPLFHIYGLMAVAGFGLFKGMTIVTMPRFDMEQYLGLIQKHGVTVAHVVPPIILGLVNHPAVDGYDLSSVRMIFSGAAPLGADLSQACIDRLGCQVMQGYGMTETSPVTHLVPADLQSDKLGSIGHLIANTECRLVDPETGKDVGAGGRGEIWVRGPQVMRGYLNNPDATASTVDEDGWLHTGDIGYVDEDGFFFIVDRVKELIKYKGLQVAPAELEGHLLTHPQVADAAVVPSPDEEAGEVPKAFVVRRGEVDAETLMAFVAERVAPHKRIRAVEFVDEIPKSASGKILRRVLVDRERAARNAAG